jgi:hypothetical protein
MGDFDLDAAGLRADGRDLEGYVEVLARKLEGALPAETVVQRRSKKLLSRDKVVQSIECALGDYRYALQFDRGRVQASRVQEVRGVAIKREPLELDAWVQELTSQLSRLAAGSTQARVALERLVD